MPPYKKHFQISLTHFFPIAPKLEKNAPIKKTIIILKQFAAILKSCLHLFQISQYQMGLRKEIIWTRPCRADVPCQNIQYSPQAWLKNQEVENS